MTFEKALASSKIWENMRLGIKAEIPAIDRNYQMYVRADYARTSRMRAAQLFNLLPASIMNIKNWIDIYICFIAELDRVLERYPDTPPVPTG